MRAHLGEFGSLPWSMIAAEEFPGDAGGLCSRGGWEEMVGSERLFCWEEMAGSERLFCFSPSIVSKR
jgi:hypothetical protein